MKTKNKIFARLFKRYQKANKKTKAQILGEYAQTLGYNRDYLALLLRNWGKTRYSCSGGKTLKFVAKAPSQGHKKAAGGKKTGRPPKYHKDFLQTLAAIWEFFDFPCGKLMAPLIRGIIEFLIADFKLTEDIRCLLLALSPATIDRKLKKLKRRYRIKAIGTSKPGTLLRSQIPVRVRFDRGERKPGFFELHTVSHCGLRACGQFCQTLTLTEVATGWTELRALLNNAHRWVKQQISHAHTTLPFPLVGIDSDNGGEFINHQLLDWCIQNNVKFTRSRPYQKNDNCFVEQKNGDVVRKTVGYARFEGEKAQKTLADLYSFLNPLLNYYYPTMQLIGKEKLPSGRYKKIYAKDPKSPYQRLLESSDVSEQCKAELRRRAQLLNPVVLKRELDVARERLLKLSVIQATVPSGKVS
jgi:hypothetical protein